MGGGGGDWRGHGQRETPKPMNAGVVRRTWYGFGVHRGFTVVLALQRGILARGLGCAARGRAEGGSAHWPVELGRTGRGRVSIRRYGG